MAPIAPSGMPRSSITSETRLVHSPSARKRSTAPEGGGFGVDVHADAVGGDPAGEFLAVELGHDVSSWDFLRVGAAKSGTDLWTCAIGPLCYWRGALRLHPSFSLKMREGSAGQALRHRRAPVKAPPAVHRQARPPAPHLRRFSSRAALPGIGRTSFHLAPIQAG